MPRLVQSPLAALVFYQLIRFSASGADALVFDAQYSLRDVFLSKADWGHSSAIIGVDIAERAQAKPLHREVRVTASGAVPA